MFDFYRKKSHTTLMIVMYVGFYTLNSTF